MKNAVRIALLIVAACSFASADSFTLATLPPAALPQASEPPAGKSYLKSSYLKCADLHSFAAAASLSKDGYIGTVHLDDSVSFDVTHGPTTQIPVPEPTSLVLLGSGLALAALRRRRRV